MTVSRISQLRSEALLMLQEGIDAPYASRRIPPGSMVELPSEGHVRRGIARRRVR